MKTHTTMLTILALAAGSAQAEGVTGKKFFEGTKPGLYRHTTVTEMSGAGVPKGQEKTTETKDHCVTKAEIESGVDDAAGCKVTKIEDSASSLFIASECRDGAKNELRMSRSGNGYTMEMKAATKGADGKPFLVAVKSDVKYIGACKG